LTERDELEKLYNDFVLKEPKITEEIEEIVKKSRGFLTGLENKIKTKESLLRKIEIETLKEEITEYKALKKIQDILRYTVILNLENFVEDYYSIVSLLSKKNYILIKVGNTWKNGNVYKGINTVLEKDDIKIEIQYHTEESYNLKEKILHKLYEEYRDTSTVKSRKKELQKEMKKISLKIKNPKGIGDINGEILFNK
jgi:putative minor head protein